MANLKQNFKSTDKCPSSCSMRYIKDLTKNMIDASPTCGKCIYRKAQKVCTVLVTLQETIHQLSNVINHKRIVLNYKKIKSIDLIKDYNTSLVKCGVHFYSSILQSVTTICASGEKCQFNADNPCDTIKIMNRTLKNLEDIMELDLNQLLPKKERINMNNTKTPLYDVLRKNDTIKNKEDYKNALAKQAILVDGKIVKETDLSIEYGSIITFNQRQYFFSPFGLWLTT